jgi:hypothetical protein
MGKRLLCLLRQGSLGRRLIFFGNGARGYHTFHLVFRIKFGSELYSKCLNQTVPSRLERRIKGISFL